MEGNKTIKTKKNDVLKEEIVDKVVMRDLMAEWQHRLGLDDWCIVLKNNCSPNEMMLQNVSGECEKDDVNKCAIIRLLDKKDYGDSILPYDKEETLVHELLHIKFWLIENTDNEMQNRFIHQLIEDMAKALVDAKKK